MNRADDRIIERLEKTESGANSEAREPDFTFQRTLLNARRTSGLTQKELAERTGIAQADISKLENGNVNPSLRTLQRLATGMGMRLKLEFLPPEE